MRSGPLLIGYDGTPAADSAVREAGELLGGRPALVLVVWQEGLGFELIETPTAGIGMPAAPLDVNTALEVDRAMAEHAQRLARHGAGLAREAGFPEAEGLAVADAPAVPVAGTIVRIAAERDAQAIVLAAHNKGRIGEILLGSTSRDVLRRADRPVLIVREAEGA
jgi:nucleotide-binding universal stress UspA family protein